MKYNVGKYVIAPEKPFPDMEAAVRYIQKKFPELERETIEKFISPKINKADGDDKSGDISEEDTAGETDSTENGPASSKRNKAGKNQPIQPIKGEN
ncbi:hypothetical protein [Chryseobacterium vrystaatense]|uniref:Uncharacterized protein n=1 Tax=Chryseobacterium vrystaatense TaxID=307480 RepID=A0A1M4ZKX1_9FLAO|nr:hypothetical protein [Chryseobacterium vrystaatense]SHF18644.1 hypothetical protein SAMN02787073_1629 [Chryseobacterium vrystaatense]